MSSISACGEIHLRGALLDAEPVELLDPLAVEHGVHRDDAFELAADRREVALLEHARGAGGLERVGRDRVPAAEHEVVERSERHEVADQRVAALAPARRGGCGPSATPSRSAPRRCWRAVRTPAITVDDTAPRPGSSTPSFPVAGAI